MLNDRVVLQHRVAILDVPEIAHHRLRRAHVSAGAEVPLEVADPKDQFSQGSSAGVELDPQKVVRIHGLAGGDISAFGVKIQAGLAVAELIERIQDLTLESLEVLKRDVEEVAAATGWVKDANAAQPVVELQ